MEYLLTPRGASVKDKRSDFMFNKIGSLFFYSFKHEISMSFIEITEGYSFGKGHISITTNNVQ